MTVAKKQSLSLNLSEIYLFHTTPLSINLKPTSTEKFGWGSFLTKHLCLKQCSGLAQLKNRLLSPYLGSANKSAVLLDAECI